MPYLRPEDFPAMRVLYEAGQLSHSVYFLEDGICSMVADMRDGTTIEVGVVGREGLVGFPVILRSGHVVNRSVVQVAGSGFSVASGILHRQLGSILPIMLQAACAFLVQATRNAACNRAHGIEARLARSLLMCFDRVEGDRLSITVESLATMLGTGHPSVTVAVGVLQAAGLIRISRASITMRNRQGLEHAACECYAFIRAEYRRLGFS